jgi:hypothetical protein
MPGLVLAYVGHGLGDVCVEAHGGLDLAELDPEAADLDLEVRAS